MVLVLFLTLGIPNMVPPTPKTDGTEYTGLSSGRIRKGRGPWRGPSGTTKITKVKYCTHLSVLYIRYPPLAFMDTLGVRGNFLSFRRPRSKKG